MTHTLDAMLELMLSQQALAKNLKAHSVDAYRARLIALGARSDWTLDEAQAAIDAVPNVNTRNLSGIAVRSILELDVRISAPVTKDWELPTAEDLKTAFAGQRYELRFWLMAVLGCRLAEACSVTANSVSGNNVVIDGQVIDGRKVSTKSGKPSVKSCPDWLIEQVKTLDGFDSPGAVRAALARLSKQHGVTLNASALRSFAANYLLSNGVELLTVSKMLGHASIGTTTTYYLRQNRLKTIEVLDTLNPAA